MNRKDAYALGLVRYNTGKLCRNGHASERYVTTGACVECLKQNRAQFSRGYRVSALAPGAADFLSASVLLGLTVPTVRAADFMRTAHAMLQARYPGIPEVALRSATGVRAGVTASVVKATVKVHPDDAEALRSLADYEIRMLSAGNFRPVVLPPLPAPPEPAHLARNYKP